MMAPAYETAAQSLEADGHVVDVNIRRAERRLDDPDRVAAPELRIERHRRRRRARRRREPSGERANPRQNANPSRRHAGPPLQGDGLRVPPGPGRGAAIRRRPVLPSTA